MKSTAPHVPVASSALSPLARRRSLDHAKPILVALAFATGLFALIALLDGVARPDDLSPGTAFAATPAAPRPADAVQAPESWGPDTSAQGTRLDGIH